MNPAIIIMTILGCGQNEAACEYIRTAEATFANETACWSRTETEILKSGSSGYPTVIAVCEPLPQMEAGLPVARADETPPAGEPKVVYAREATPQKPNPVRWAVVKTGQALGGMKIAIVKTWRKITHKNRENEQPVLLGRYVEMDS